MGEKEKTTVNIYSTINIKSRGVPTRAGKDGDGFRAGKDGDGFRAGKDGDGFRASASEDISSINIHNTTNIFSDMVEMSQDLENLQKGRGSIKALSCHIGLDEVDPNHYGSEMRLKSCVKDAQDMKRIAYNHDYRSQILINEEATREAVSNAIEKAATELTGGDIFFLTYAGHGGWIPNDDIDEIGEEDNRDETWCLFDGEMLDDEIGHLWTKFRVGVRIVLLSDSCHSGTIYRAMRRNPEDLPRNTSEALQGIKTQYRALPFEVAINTYENHREFYDSIRAAINNLGKMAPVMATVRTISACQDDQLAEDGQDNGRFTWTLKKIYAGGNFSGSYEEFYNTIKDIMPATQEPKHSVIGPSNTLFDAQCPFQII